MAADYDVLVYTEVGGSKLVVASGGEIEVQSGATLDIQDGATFNVDVVSITDTLTIGSDGAGHDVTFYGDTSGSYFLYDADTCRLNLVGPSSLFRLGDFSGSTHGSGCALSASNTAGFRVYADDNNAAIGSGSLVRAGWFRNLQTYTGGNREQESCGVQGSLVSSAGTNRHNMCGVLGSYEVKGTITVDGQAAATDTWCQAGVIGRVGAGASVTLTLNNNGILAGLAAMSNINSSASATYTGEYCGVYVGAWGSADDFEIGLLIEDAKTTTGIDIGACTTGINLSGAMTDGIIIGGACGDNGIEITGACTDSAIQVVTGAFGTGLKLDADGTTGIDITSNFSGTDMIVLAGTATAYGIELTGVCTTAGIFLGTTNKLMFHDTGMYMRASADGHLEIVSDDTITLSSPGHGSIVFGGETDWGTGSTGHDIDGSGWDWVTQTVGHVDSGALATAVAAAYHAMTVTVNQTTSTSVFGTWTELYIASGVDLGGSDNYAAVWGQVECLGSVTTPDTGNFMAAVYGNFIAPTTFTIATGVAVNGFRANLEAGTVSTTGTARTAAFEATASATDWDYGLYIVADTCTTGIYVGDCTTAAINIAGDQAIGILFDVDSAATDGLKILVDDGITLTTGINLDRSGTTGIVTTAISIDTDGTTGIDIAAGFTGTTGLQIAGTSADAILISGACSDNGVEITGVCSGAAFLTSGASVKAFEASAIACASGGYGMSVVSTITDGASDGIAGYFEGHIAGTPTGNCFGLGAWVNVDTTTAGCSEIRAIDAGIYARGQDLSGTGLVVLNLDYHADAANPPSQGCMIRFNCHATGATPTYLFRATGQAAAAYEGNTLHGTSAGDKIGAVKVYIAGGAAVPGYIYIYDHPGQ